MSSFFTRARALARAVLRFLLAGLRLFWKVTWVSLMVGLAGVGALFMPPPPPPKPKPPLEIKDEDDEDKDPV